MISNNSSSSTPLDRVCGVILNSGTPLENVLTADECQRIVDAAQEPDQASNARMARALLKGVPKTAALITRAKQMRRLLQRIQPLLSAVAGGNSCSIAASNLYLEVNRYLAGEPNND